MAVFKNTANIQYFTFFNFWLASDAPVKGTAGSLTEGFKCKLAFYRRKKKLYLTAEDK